jgi:hypothetical protein
MVLRSVAVYNLKLGTGEAPDQARRANGPRWAVWLALGTCDAVRGAVVAIHVGHNGAPDARQPAPIRLVIERDGIKRHRSTIRALATEIRSAKKWRIPRASGCCAGLARVRTLCRALSADIRAL